MFHLLFNQILLSFTVVSFVVLLLLFLTKHQTISRRQKILIVIILAIIILYLIFIVWASIGFANRHPSKEPIPTTFAHFKKALHVKSA